MSSSNVVLIKNIDGFEIVRGIDKLQIDPIASQSIIDAELTNTDEFIACKIEQDKMKEKFINAGDKLKQSNKAKVQGNKTLSLSLYREYKSFYDEALEIMKEVRKLYPAVKKARKKLFKTYAIYFHPNAYERIKTDEEIEAIKTLIENLSIRKLIKSDGTLVDNYSGLSLFHKENNLRPWIRTDIKKINVDKPAGSKLFKYLLDEEKVEAEYDMNIKRVSLLSVSEKEKEKLIELDKALINATNMRSGLEIQNDAEALTKSQAWYNDKVTELNDLYQ